MLCEWFLNVDRLLEREIRVGGTLQRDGFGLGLDEPGVVVSVHPLGGDGLLLLGDDLDHLVVVIVCRILASHTIVEAVHVGLVLGMDDNLLTSLPKRAEGADHGHLDGGVIRCVPEGRLDGLGVFAVDHSHGKGAVALVRS